MVAGVFQFQPFNVNFKWNEHRRKGCNSASDLLFVESVLNLKRREGRIHRGVKIKQFKIPLVADSHGIGHDMLVETGTEIHASAGKNKQF